MLELELYLSKWAYALDHATAVIGRSAPTNLYNFQSNLNESFVIEHRAVMCTEVTP